MKKGREWEKKILLLVIGGKQNKFEGKKTKIIRHLDKGRQFVNVAHSLNV